MIFHLYIYFFNIIFFNMNAMLELAPWSGRQCVLSAAGCSGVQSSAGMNRKSLKLVFLTAVWDAADIRLARGMVNSVLV